jgi:hypothetical protein
MRVIVVFGLLLALAGCGGPSAADMQATVGAAVQATADAEQVAQSVAATQAAADVCGAAKLNAYADTVEEQLQTFEAQTGLASSTPRVSLGTPLQKLLDIQTETRRMDAPECLKAYHEQLVGMMGLYRLAYETFAAQGDETLVQASLQVGGETLATLKQGLTTIRQGQVPPTPVPATPVAVAPTTSPAPTASSGKGVAQATVTGSGERVVKYEVTGTVERAFVTYTNATGGIEQNEVTLPWTEEFPAGDVRFVSLSAQNRTGDGSVSCLIKVNESEVQQATSSAGFGIASCSGSTQ